MLICAIFKSKMKTITPWQEFKDKTRCIVFQGHGGKSKNCNYIVVICKYCYRVIVN